MLVKLLKYEFRSIIKNFLAVYLIIILAAIAMLKISVNWGSGFLAAFIITAIIMCFVYAITRFNKSLLGDEGYLMFTVPVKTHTIVASKLIAITIMTILTWIFITIVAFLLSYYGSSKEGTLEFFGVIKYGTSIRGATLLFLNTLLGFITQYVFTVLLIYMSLSIGQIGKLKKYKSISAIAIFFGTSYLIGKILDIVFNLISNSASEYYGVFAIFQSYQGNENLTPEQTIHLFNNIFTLGNIANIVLSIILFFATVYILDRHLNLD